MYDVFNRKIVTDFIYQDGICKGYSIHFPRAVRLWNNLLNCLLECFSEEFSDIKIINNVPPMYGYDFLSNFYGKHFYRLENRIPTMIDDTNSKVFITTDALPYLTSKLNNSDAVFSSYTVVRPRSFAVKPFLREEFIRYFQFVIATDEKDLSVTINKIFNAANMFFNRTRIATVIVDRHSDSYYLKKSCYHSVWMNGNIESVLQCGILKKHFDTVSGTERVVIDIGGAQRLLATFIYNNSDKYGLFLPYHLRDYDIVVRADQNTKIIERFVKYAIAAGYRVKICPANLPLKKAKNIAVEESVLAVVAQRKVAGNDFLTIYNRDMSISNIHTDSEITEWIHNYCSALESLSYRKQKTIIDSKITNQVLYYKNEKKGYTVIQEGLFS